MAVCEGTVGHSCCFRRSRHDEPEPERGTQEANSDPSRTESPASTNNNSNNALQRRAEPQIIGERVGSDQSTQRWDNSQTCSVSSETIESPENPRHDDNIQLNEYAHSIIFQDLTVESQC